jgi:hypothetical protein
MRQNEIARKPFAPPTDVLNAYGALPPLLVHLVRPEQLLWNPSAADLREMSKFTELPNLQGGAAHPINYPAPAELGEKFKRAEWNAGLVPSTCSLNQEPLSSDLQKNLARRLARQTNIVITGRLAGTSRFPVEIVAIFPQSTAHLAAAMQQMLWSGDCGLAPSLATYSLLMFGDPLAGRTGTPERTLLCHVPDAGCGLILGYDDPRLLAVFILDAAHRAWSAADPFLKIEALTRESAAPFLPWNPVLRDGVNLTPVWMHPLLPAQIFASFYTDQFLPPGSLTFGIDVDQNGLFRVCENEVESGVLIFGANGRNGIDELDGRNGRNGG